MSSGVILCEGETDQILIGAYLHGRQGWCYSSEIRPFFSGRQTHVYVKDSDHLEIWAVGGHDFRSAIGKIAERQLMSSDIDRIAIVTDHDDASAETERLEEICEILENKFQFSEPSDLGQVCNRWADICYKDMYGTQAKMKFCYLLVPAGQEGTLESFMLECLSEGSPERENVIFQCRRFVDTFQSDFYLKKRREKVKAKLGVSMTVFSPDKIFTTMNELIQSVDWSKSEVSRIQFGPLEDFCKPV